MIESSVTPSATERIACWRLLMFRFFFHNTFFGFRITFRTSSHSADLALINSTFSERACKNLGKLPGYASSDGRF